IHVQHLARLLAISLIAMDFDAILRRACQQGQIERLGLVAGLANVLLPAHADLAQTAGQRLGARLHRWFPNQAAAGRKAVASTSTSHCGEASACTITRVDAGLASPRNAARTGPSNGTSAGRVKNVVTLTTCRICMPAACSTATRFDHARRAWPSKSSASLPLASTPTWPAICSHVPEIGRAH